MHRDSTSWHIRDTHVLTSLALWLAKVRIHAYRYLLQVKRPTGVLFRVSTSRVPVMSCARVHYWEIPVISGMCSFRVFNPLLHSDIPHLIQQFLWTRRLCKTVCLSQVVCGLFLQRNMVTLRIVCFYTEVTFLPAKCMYVWSDYSEQLAINLFT